MCFVMHREVDSQPMERPKKNGGTGSVTLLKISGQLGCVFPKSYSIFAEGHKILGTTAQRAILKGASRHLKFQEGKGPSQGVIQHIGSHVSLRVEQRSAFLTQFLATKRRALMLLDFFSRPPDHMYPSGGFSFNIVNCVKLVHGADGSWPPSRWYLQDQGRERGACWCGGAGHRDARGLCG